MSGVLSASGFTIFNLGFVISPIILKGGIATNFGIQGFLPIAVLTEGVPAFGAGISPLTQGLAAGAFAINASNQFSSGPFATFYPLPGGTVIDYELGRYPLGNQAVAANAIIAEPLHIPMMMVAPVKAPGGYTAKLATMTALRSTLANHCESGGLFIVATPAFIYTDCILRRITDVSTGETEQRQFKWQFDFEKPLISLNDAAGAQNLFMSKITNGLPNDGSTSGPNAAVPTLPPTQGLSGSVASGP